jgi:hypothetical protein
MLASPFNTEGSHTPVQRATRLVPAMSRKEDVRWNGTILQPLQRSHIGASSSLSLRLRKRAALTDRDGGSPSPLRTPGSAGLLPCLVTLATRAGRGDAGVHARVITGRYRSRKGAIHVVYAIYTGSDK